MIALNPSMVFKNRKHAGALLAKKLEHYRTNDIAIMALPRGGVIVGYEIAKKLKIAFDVLIAQKIALSENPEFGIGALAEGSVQWINQDIIDTLQITKQELKEAHDQAEKEMYRRIRAYHTDRPAFVVKDKTIILVDDGLATGVTALVAARSIYMRGAKKVILAVPVASEDGLEFLKKEVDTVECLSAPQEFFSVGSHYKDFEQVTDLDVISVLNEANKLYAVPQPKESEKVNINESGIRLEGTLTIPKDLIGLVIFAHGSSNERFDVRNLSIAKKLNEDQLGTLVVDLLTAKEKDNRDILFNIELLAERLILVTQWVFRKMQDIAHVPIGYYGINTTASAALCAAADLGAQISGIVSQSGRPDLVREKLEKVKSPTLLIVGSYDDVILDLNESVIDIIPNAELKIVAGATHLFEEPSTLDQVAEHASHWFIQCFTGHKRRVA